MLLYTVAGSLFSASSSNHLQHLHIAVHSASHAFHFMKPFHSQHCLQQCPRILITLLVVERISRTLELRHKSRCVRTPNSVGHMNE